MTSAVYLNDVIAAEVPVIVVNDYLWEENIASFPRLAGNWRIVASACYPSEVIVAGVQVTAVHNYRGEENDIIILSVLRSNVTSA